MDKIYVKNPDVIFRHIAEEFILVPIRQKVVDLKSVYTLNEVAAFIWELIDGKNDTSKIVYKVVEEFDVDSLCAAKDTKEMFSQLEGLQLIQGIDSRKNV